MTASLSGVSNLQSFDDSGAMAVGGRLYTYIYGTTNHKAAYTDAAGLVPHTYTEDDLGGQYIAMDARGELPAPLYLTTGSYDLCYKTADGATVWTRRADPGTDLVLDVVGDVTVDGDVTSLADMLAHNFYHRVSDTASAGTWGFSTASGPQIQMFGTAAAGAGDIYFCTAEVPKLRLTNAGNFIPYTDNVGDCGGSAKRWGTVYGYAGNFSSGVTFGGSTLANYAEGSWTPALKIGGAFGTTTYSAQSGWYTRIGNVVFFGGSIQINTYDSSTGGLTFSATAAIPYSAAAGTYPVNITADGLTLSSPGWFAAGRVGDDPEIALRINSTAGSVAAVVGANVTLANGAFIAVEGFYKV